MSIDTIHPPWKATTKAPAKKPALNWTVVARPNQGKMVCVGCLAATLTHVFNYDDWAAGCLCLVIATTETGVVLLAPTTKEIAETKQLHARDCLAANCGAADGVRFNVETI